MPQNYYLQTIWISLIIVSEFGSTRLPIGFSTEVRIMVKFLALVIVAVAAPAFAQDCANGQCSLRPRSIAASVGVSLQLPQRQPLQVQQAQYVQPVQHVQHVQQYAQPVQATRNVGVVVSAGVSRHPQQQASCRPFQRLLSRFR